MNWFDIAYLLNGNERQKAAYDCLQKLGIFDHLADYSPVLVGTIPIDIDIEGSDLDILLKAQDLPALATKLERLYQPKESRYGEQNGVPYYLAKLDADNFEIEFFVQDKATTLQNGYRHMLIEYRLLQLGGETAREAIRQLKKDGMKTEPAFAHYFGILQDPYESLLEISAWDDEKLQKLRK